jgi:heptosyltransferase-2
VNVLVIKQTSLGDVLHATGHVRAIREQFPDCHLTLLTADTSAAIFRHNPCVDEIIEFERYRIKARWWRHPMWTARHVADTLQAVRGRRYDLAIDLQGRWKSVLFLYGARAGKRFVKGRWPFLNGYRNRELHALDEMDRVLELSGVRAADTHMEFFTSAVADQAARAKLTDAGLGARCYVVISPFTRWPSKDWSLDGYADVARGLPGDVAAVITGAACDRTRVERFLSNYDLRGAINLCGALDLEQFAACVRGARAVISGDSFAMHTSVACGTPVVALFGPTAESRVGPRGRSAVTLRADVGCRVCYRRDCAKRCIDAIGADRVLDALEHLAGIVPQACDQLVQ